MTTQTDKPNKPEAPEATSKPEVKMLALQVSREVHKALRVAAAEGETTVKAIVEEAVKAFLKNGETATSK